MTSFTFTLDEILTAPPSVRYWFEQQLGQAISQLSPRQRTADSRMPDPLADSFAASGTTQEPALAPQHASAVIPLRQGASPMHLLPVQATTAPAAVPLNQLAVSACSLPEVAQIFDQVSANVSTMQVFFELGRGQPAGNGHTLRVVSAADIMRAAHLPDGQHLLTCLATINRAFQQTRDRTDISLFGLDQVGHLFVHETTCRNIRQLWDQLVASEADQLARFQGVSPDA